ncbi:MAG TPA: amidohydrolase, partial [Bacteroidales bacterium]|nr:amidohydrolase [Bacteroidales bacterium]
MKYQYLMSILLASGAVLSCKGPETADFIVKNSKIYTVDGNSRIAESFAVRGGLILAVGSDQEIDRSYNSDQVIDLGGKPVYPGFYDAHCHFAGYADNLRKADLTDTKSFGEICQRLVEHQKSFPSEWVLGRGWDQNDWPGRQFPDRSELDTYFPDLPVYLTRVDGHAAVVNTAALKLAGIDYKTRVTGGEIICVNGKITGVLVDNAMDLVSRFIPDMPTGESTKALLRAQENCFAVGLTTVADAGLSFSTVQLMDQLHKEGQLKMRVYAMLS